MGFIVITLPSATEDIVAGAVSEVAVAITLDNDEKAVKSADSLLNVKALPDNNVAVTISTTIADIVAEHDIGDLCRTQLSLN